MSKLDVITIAIVIVCLALLGFLVYKIVDLMKTPESGNGTSIADTYGENTDPANADDVYNYDDEVNDANADNTGDLDDDEVNYTSEDEYDMSSDDVAETTDESSNETATTPPRPATVTEEPSSSRTEVNSYSSSGQYMVIAGSYRERANADNQVSRLKSMGYNSAEVRLFDRGSYALVLVDRFSSKSEAQALERELEGKGVDAFVQAKR